MSKYNSLKHYSLEIYYLSRNVFAMEEERLCRTYVNPAFVSTTLLREHFSVQARSNGLVIRIDVPVSTPGAYITELNNATIAEYEVLFPRYLKFKRTETFTYEIIPELPADKYRGEYVDKSSYYTP